MTDAFDKILSELKEITKQTPENLLSAEEVTRRVDAYLQDMSESRVVAPCNAGGIVVDYAIRDTERGCYVHGLDEHGESITKTFLRARRHAKKVGRKQVGSMVITCDAMSTIPGHMYTITMEIPRV